MKSHTMKKLLLVLLWLPIFGVQAQESDVKAAIDTFFAGFHAKDTVKINSVISKEMVLHSVTEVPGGSRFSAESAANLAQSILSIPKDIQIEERILSYDIKIDGAMAHAWTPYEFYVNGKLSHKGVNSFQLYKDTAGWKITYIIDTRRK